MEHPALIAAVETMVRNCMDHGGFGHGKVGGFCRECTIEIAKLLGDNLFKATAVGIATAKDCDAKIATREDVKDVYAEGVSVGVEWYRAQLANLQGRLDAAIAACDGDTSVNWKASYRQVSDDADAYIASVKTESRRVTTLVVAMEAELKSLRDSRDACQKENSRIALEKQELSVLFDAAIKDRDYYEILYRSNNIQRSEN